MTALQDAQAWPHYDGPTSAKFVPPTLPRHWVRRDRLDWQLSVAVQRPLTILTGPPGAGKSVLLADWALGYTSGVAAWLSLDEADNDPEQFWSSVACALGGCGASDDLRIGPAAEAPEDQLAELVLRQAPGEPPRVLIVDNFHLVTNDCVIEPIARLARRLPSKLRLVLAGQGTPAFALRRLVRDGQATLIEDRDLRFTVEESGALVALIARKFLPIEQLAALTDGCEGWAAGLQVAAVALTEADPSEFVGHFSGAFGPVAEYIEHEMLQRQPPDIVRFLLQTSVLSYLTPDLCRAVSGRGDADAILASLANRNLFVAHSGEAERGYRYHHLLADLLRSRLQLENPMLEQRAHFDAACWFERCGDVRPAAHHFAEAGAYEHALPLVFIDDDGPAHEVPAREVPAHEWDDRSWTNTSGPRPCELSGICVEDGPIRTYTVAATLIRGQRASEAVELLRRLNAATEDGDHRRQWEGRTEFLWALHADALGDAAAVLEHCSAAEELLRPAGGTGPPESSDPVGTWLAAVDASIWARLPSLTSRAHASLGQLEESKARLTAHFGTQAAAETSQPSILAVVACGEGRLRDAFRLAKAALQQAGAQGGSSRLANLDARLALAEALFEHNQLDMARDQLDAALKHCPPDGAAPWLWAVEASLARVLVAQGRPSEALMRLGRLRQLGLRNPPPHHLLRQLDDVEITCRLSLGDLEGALLVARSVRPGEIRLVTLARIELCSGRPDRAYARLSTSQSVCPADEIRRLVLLACAEIQQGHAAAAYENLRRALDTGRGDGYVRPFLEEATQVLPLLRSIAAERPDPYLTELVREVELVVPNLAQTPPSGIVEPLTAREREVLGYLSSHFSGRDIAAKIYVSPNTVKSHMKAIYRKIGAASRAEAVEIAVSRGLL